jgi:hypothetical protein
MTFLIFLAVVAIAYFTWRIADQIPDLIFRLSEVQRDIAEMRKHLVNDDATEAPASGAAASDGDSASSGDSDE